MFVLKNKMYKVLQVIDALEIGGAEKVFIDLSNLLHENEVDVSALFILQPGKWAYQLHANIKQHTLNRTFKWSLPTLYRCARIIRQYDIIHCHHRYVFAYINLCAMLFGVRTKIILNDHYGLIDLNQQVPKNIAGIFKPVYFIGVSKKLTIWAKEILKVDAKQVYLLANIVRRIRQPIEADKTNDWILVSNIKPVKNQLFAIALAQKMNKSLLIVGNIQDAKYHRALKDAIAKGGGRITIQTHITDVRPFLAQATMGLHVSTSETGPLALIEYLSKGLPFVAYDTGEVAQMIKSVFPEMVVPNFDIPHWEEAIKLVESSITPRYQQAINNFYEANFSEDQYVNQCLSIYSSILADS
jgi:glycosyltransferase involved in cell wall biosynthesis